MSIKCSLLLSDGTEIVAESFGYPLNTSGELVFTTSMVGYSETLTDPSFLGQIVIFSYPLIGNYGIEKLDNVLSETFEREKIHLSGVIISSLEHSPQHNSSCNSLSNWLTKNKIPALIVDDTRFLVEKVRDNSKVLGRIVFENNTRFKVWKELKINEKDLRGRNSFFDPSEHCVLKEFSNDSTQNFGTGKLTIGLIDCGSKWGIIRSLLSHDVKVIRVPWTYDFTSLNCDGWVISNGPGIPDMNINLINKISKLIDTERPILGICLGCQLLALACGASTYRVKWPHRGSNHPVINTNSNKGFITPQNHSFAICEQSLSDDWEVTYRNINDKSIEGIKHRSKNIIGIQFHPEASPGPFDTMFIFDDFINSIRELL